MGQQGHSVPVPSVAFSPDGKYIISGSEDNTIKVWDVRRKKLLVDIYTDNFGHWASFDLVEKVLYRHDNGTLVLDKNGSSFLPYDNTKEDALEISIPKKISIKSRETISLEVEIENVGNEKSYWLRVACDDNSTIFYPNMIYKLKPLDKKQLKIKISANLPKENKKPFSKKIELKFFSANGEVTTKELSLKHQR